MILKKTYFLFFPFLLFLAVASATEPGGFSISNKSTCQFRFNPAVGSSLNNFFIKEIAKYNYLELYKTSYTLSFEHTINVEEISPGSYEFSSAMIFYELTGDIFYEGYNLSDVLLPSVLSFDLLVYDKDFRLLKIFNFKDLLVKNPDGEEIYSLETPGKSGLIFKITNTGFKYSESDKAGFVGRILQINEFLGFLDLSARTTTKAIAINPDDEGTILSNYLKIFDLERFCKVAATTKFDTNLAIPAKDTLAYSQNLKNISTNLRRLKTIFDQNTDTLSAEIGTGEISAAADQIIEIQLGYIESLNNSNYLFQPVYQLMAEMFKKEDSWPLLLNEISEYFAQRPNIRLEQDFEDFFSLALYQKHIAKADSFINLENFNDAVLMLESAATVCLNCPKMECDIEVFNKLSKAKFGIYDAYLRIAGQALDKKNPDMAKNYLELARSFQNENRSMIMSEQLTNQNFEILAWEYTERGRQNLKNGASVDALADLWAASGIYQQLKLTNFSAALKNDLEKAFNLKFEELVTKAENGLKSNKIDEADFEAGQIQLLAIAYPEIDFNHKKFDNLKTTIRENRFNILLNNLETSLQTGHFDQAMILIKTLREGEPDDFNKAADELANFFQMYLKPAFLEKVSLAKTMFQEGKKNDSDQLVAEILKLKNNFPGFRDAEVENAFKGLLKTFETEECGALKSNIARQTDESIQLIASKNYYQAKQKIEDALRQITALEKCSVSDSTLKSLQGQYSKVFAYYEMLAFADDKFEKNDFLAAIEVHLKAENYFYKEEIYRFDETYRPIDEFITSKSSSALNSVAIGYYSRQKDYRKVVSLLHVYLQHGFDIEKYDSYLAEAGATLSAKDKARYPQNDPVFMLEKFTLGKQAFQPFKTAYLKEWKGKKNN